MKQCCRCCAELGDNTWILYEWEGELYCSDCLIDALVKYDVISEVLDDDEEDDEEE